MGAPFKAQANALMRKQAVFQKRSVKQNLCFLSAPIVFCLLLLIVQLLINNLLLTGEDFECGCECLECCTDKTYTNCTTPANGLCTGTGKCKTRNTANCGLAYSKPGQAVFCPIAHPSSWPAVLQVPAMDERAQPWRPKAALLYTGASSATADALSAGLIPQPKVDAAALDELVTYFDNWNTTAAGNGGYQIPAELLSVLGFTFGSSTDNPANLFIEPSFSDSVVDAMVPDGYCEQLNLTTGINITFNSFLAAVVKASNTPVQAQEINTAVGAAGLGQTLRFKVNCTDTPLSNTGSTANLTEQLFCGYYEAKCSGRPETNEFTGAYDWGNTSVSNYSPSIYTNDTWGLTAGQPSVYQRIPQLFNLAVNSWLETVMPQATKRAELIGVGNMPKVAWTLSLDFSSLLGPLFYTWVVQILLPIFLVQLVYEKEKRLRIMMKMHGLGDGAYWLVTYMWDLLLYCVYIIIFLVFGSAIGLNLFRKNSYGLQIIFYFLWGNCMIAFAFLLSCFFSSSRTAIVFAFLWVFGTGIFGNLLLSNLIDANKSYMIAIELIPSFALYRGLYEFGSYAFLAVYRNSAGMQFDDLGDNGNGMVGTWIIFIVEWFVFLVLAWYLEQTMSAGTGVHRGWFFCLDGLRKKRNRTSPGDVELPPASAATSNNGHIQVQVSDEGTDVAAERRRVEALTPSELRNQPIVVRELKKVFPAVGGAPIKVAVRRLNLAVEKGECFGLLGPNGAGKSTAINMMVGFLAPSSGTAIIGGYDISKDMNKVYETMGVCPQQDLLWEMLTGREHLLFYGRLKGLAGPELNAAVDAGLKSVNLWNGKVGDKQSQQYSGGMKRRLSVAISFMGSPAVVYLDEPSTGLDPASRRNLWDVVKSSKAGRGMVLTTHSMEEAEILCDRLGIFVDGQLVCLGNPKELTSRYGGYYVFTITVPPENQEDAQAMVLRMAPGARLTYSLGGTLKYELPQNEVTLSQVFQSVSDSKQSLGVLDWGVANATLEEVFIQVSRQVGAETKDLA